MSATAILVFGLIVAAGAAGFMTARSGLSRRMSSQWQLGFAAGTTYAVAAHERALRQSGMRGADAARVGEEMEQEIQQALAADRAAGKIGVSHG